MEKNPQLLMKIIPDPVDNQDSFSRRKGGKKPKFNVNKMGYTKFGEARSELSFDYAHNRTDYSGSNHPSTSQLAKSTFKEALPEFKSKRNSDLVEVETA